MTPRETRELIEAAGGDKAFATLLGIAERAGFQQQMNNWKRRGIPARIELVHQGAIDGLRNDHQRRRRSAA